MAFDGIVVASLASELKHKLLNGRISKIAQPEADELLLTVKSTEGQYRLSISADASLPLLYLTSKNKPSPMTAPNFCMLLRKHISAAALLISGSRDLNVSFILQLNISMNLVTSAGKI